MATRRLGETLDIHTASRNLIFPHHENEIAIAEALTGKPLARYWLHSELVLVDGKMMSTDAGNAVTLSDILDRGFTAREVRFMLLSVHYRKPINFSFKRLENVRTALRRLDEFTCRLLCLPAGKPEGSAERGALPAPPGQSSPVRVPAERSRTPQSRAEQGWPASCGAADGGHRA